MILLSESKIQVWAYLLKILNTFWESRNKMLNNETGNFVHETFDGHTAHLMQQGALCYYGYRLSNSAKTDSAVSVPPTTTKLLTAIFNLNRPLLIRGTSPSIKHMPRFKGSEVFCLVERPHRLY